MMLGRYGPEGDLELPRVVTVSISSQQRRLPKRGQPLAFLVRFHEEGTPVTWQRDVVLDPATEGRILEAVARLDAWTTGTGGRRQQVLKTVDALGKRLFDAFLGDDGVAYLAEHRPTSLMLDVDETVMSLPWELMRDHEGLLVERVPFGRIVSTRTIPRPERDPLREDRRLCVLAVVDPTGDIAFVEDELAALRKASDGRDDRSYRLEVLEGATKAALARAVESGEVDVLHFSGHGVFDERRPTSSGLVLADGELTTPEILALPWQRPPYLVFTGACWSGRAARGRRLTNAGHGGNGVAAAFLAAGVSAFVGWFWPVSMRSAAAFVRAFYPRLLREGSVGEAFRLARQDVLCEFRPSADIGGHGAVLYGDAGTGVRRRLEPVGRADEQRRHEPSPSERRGLLEEAPPDDRRDLVSAV